MADTKTMTLKDLRDEWLNTCGAREDLITRSTEMTKAQVKEENKQLLRKLYRIQLNALEAIFESDVSDDVLESILVNNLMEGHEDCIDSVIAMRKRVGRS